MSANSEITVTVRFKYAGAYVDGKIRTIIVGDKEMPIETTTETTSEYEISCSVPAKEVTIAGNGVKILEITTK